jgi:hypothetical protein
MHMIRSLACVMLVMALAACQQPATGAIDELVGEMDQRYPRDAIEQRLEEAMRLYDLPLTDAGYERAVAVLGEMRETALEQGCDECDEMEILQEMIALHQPGTELSFEQAARGATAMLLRHKLYEQRSAIWFA